MTEEKQGTSSWDDLADVSDTSTKVVRAPATSEAAGRDVFVRIKALAPLDLIRALNFPMDEVNRLATGKATEDEYQKAMAEHISTFGVEDMFAMVEETVRTGLVEPDPQTGDVKKLSRDFGFLFGEITAMTLPSGSVAERARFR